MFNFSRALCKQSKCLFSLSRTFSAGVSVTAELKKIEPKTEETPDRRPKTNGIVAAAFASLALGTQSSIDDVETPYTDEKITKAKNVNELLNISNGNGVSRRHALKVVSVLAGWTATGAIALADFEADPRFLKLCRILTKGTYVKPSKASLSKSEDLSTIMNVTADDEAAKLVASITLPQMVKVMQTLAAKKRRSTLLLRSLAFNITRSTTKLDLKQSADLLYSMCALNFSDENLLQRIGNDVIAQLEFNLKKSAVVGSIVTSLGLLRYKEPNVLDALSGWILNNYGVCRSQDVFGLFLTLAVLNYRPPNFDALYEAVIPHFSPADAPRPQIWLDFVWSLVLLNKSSSEHVSHVLSENFLAELNSEGLTIPGKLKLLNINGAAKHLIKNYNGPTIDQVEQITGESLSRSKEKEEMVQSVLETIKNLVQSDDYIRVNVNSGMGFYIDAECLFDPKCNPVSFSHADGPDFRKVAILTLDYHDLCRGRAAPTGVNSLAVRLLEAKGFRVLQVPYHEYRPKDKLVQRVQYLESRLKTLVQT